MPTKRGFSFGVPQCGEISDDRGWIGLKFTGFEQSIDVFTAEVDGVPQIVGLRIDPTTPWAEDDGSFRVLVEPNELTARWAWCGPGDSSPVITSDLLRALPLRQLLTMAVVAGDEPGTTDPLEPLRLERPSGGWPDEHYKEVAETYRKAGSAPIKAIAARWGVSRAAASKWVHKARELGYLGYPERPGVSGASKSKSPIKRQKRAGERGTSHGR